MQRKTLVNRSLIMGLLLALSLAPSGLPRAVASQASAQEVDPAAIQANVGSGFSYQGFLAQAGQPVNATCRFVFALFDRLAGGNQLGANQEVGGVTVSDGSFALILNGANQFGNDAFNGQARWLEITVDCGSGSSTLSPRQELLAAPYALSLRPGAVVTANGPENSGLLSLAGGYHGLRVLSTSDDGIYVDAAGDNGIRTAAANYGGFFNGGVGGVLAAALTAEGPDLVLGGFTDSDGVYHGEGRITTSPLSASSSLYLQSNGNATIQLDADGVDSPNSSFVVMEGVERAEAVTHLQVNAEGVEARRLFVEDSIGVLPGAEAIFFDANSDGVYVRSHADATPDLILGGFNDSLAGDNGIISSDPAFPSSDIVLRSNDTVLVELDFDQGGEASSFEVRDNNNNLLFIVEANGDVCIGNCEPRN